MTPAITPRRAVAISISIASTLWASSLAAAPSPRVQLSVESREIYAGLPFVLGVTADGFDEAPEPKIGELAINRCRVVFLGVSPNVSSSIQIVNGVRSQSRRVTFVYRYRIEATEPGNYQVPAITVEQGSKKASTQPASFHAGEIADSPEMKLRIGLPERPVWVGETFEMTLDWYLRRDPKNPSFVVPLFDREDWVAVRAPDDGKGEGALAFLAGSREIELPYTRTGETFGGSEFTRLSFRAVVTPTRPGKLELPAAKVVSQLQVGVGRDSFGFRVPRMGIFKAEDQPRVLEIRALPMANRPDSFANAVGAGFSIDVQASRTVVQVGDPIELTLIVRGDAMLDGVSLPGLDGEGGLSPALFDIADDPPPGEIVDGAKRFVITVRLKSAEAREIPPLAFSYFDPKKAQYQTVRSQPIALSVAGSAMVGAGDVVGGSHKPDPGELSGAPASGSLVGADLALSAEDDTLDAPISPDIALGLSLALCILPLIVLGVRVWQVRTRAERREQGELRRRLGDVEREIERAASSPGNDSAPRIASALRSLARAAGDGASRDLPGDLIAELENQSYSPRAASEPLAEALRERALTTARQLAQRTRPGGSAAGAAAVVLLCAVAWSGDVVAAGGELARARDTYRAALEQTDRDARTRGFAAAERAFRELVAGHADRPELLTDWGNAALGARDLGRATLAYRRALRHDASLDRARRNLAWVREGAPSWLPRAPGSGAIDALFFWHRELSRAQRMLLGSLAFALAVLLVTPWRTRRDRAMRRGAILPLALATAMAMSLILERDASRDAVVIADGVVLRSADSVGAPPTLANPLPAGAEGVLVETRDSWTRIQLADGTRGWLPTTAVERVVPR